MTNTANAFRFCRLIIMILILEIIINTNKSYSQQIGNGYETYISNFGDILTTGAYNSNGPSGGVPDNNHPWQHLLVLRHPNETNNHQLQIGATFAENERLFFRKIANGLSPKSPTWVELATRNSNTFNGDQYINGNLNIASSEDGGLLIGQPNDAMGLNGGCYSLKFYGYRDIIPNVISAKITAERTNVCCGWLAQGTDLAFYTTASIGTANADNSIERLRIKDNGNVGIGTTSPQNKLDVNGTIRAKEVKVTLDGWSDFVFKSTYKLKPLTEVEQYINNNGHLPEVPSETEVKQNGVNVGDMQSKLLQKVEELTLYTIAQEKENAELKQKLYEQELKLKKLEELITNKIN